jgi:DNA-binding NarL/FixJ family response regulator
VVLLSAAPPPDQLARGIATLRAAAPALKPLLLGPGLNERAIQAGLSANAIGYVSTNDSVAALGEAIKRAHAGEIVFPPRLLANPLRPAPPPPERRPLGARELQVLQVLATGVTAEQAAAQLSITVQTLRTHVRNVMAKLEAHSKVEAIVLALQAGLIELPPLPSGGAPCDLGGAAAPARRQPARSADARPAGRATSAARGRLP